VLPETWPWYAPECRAYPEFTPAQAAKSDVFSFGMLCLWFLFEKYLSGVLPLPKASQSASAFHTYEDVNPSLGFLEDLKKKGSLAQFADQLVMAEAGLDAKTREMLRQFFQGCLACDPQSRDVDMQHSLKHMNIHQYELLDLAMNIAKYCYRTQLMAQTALTEAYSPADHDFKVSLPNDKHRSLSD
jgi:hypothetical protein